MCEITVACTPVTPAGGRSGSLHVPVLLSRAPRSTSISPSPATDWSSLLLTYPAAPSPTHRGNKSGQLWKSSVVPCGSGRPTQHHDGRVQIQTTHLSLPTTSPPCCPARAYSKPQAILGPLPRRSAHRSRHPLICHDAQPCPSPCDRRRISANDRFSLQQCPQAQQPSPVMRPNCGATCVAWMREVYQPALSAYLLRSPLQSKTCRDSSRQEEANHFTRQCADLLT